MTERSSFFSPSPALRKTKTFYEQIAKDYESMYYNEAHRHICSFICRFLNPYLTKPIAYVALDRTTMSFYFLFQDLQIISKDSYLSLIRADCEEQTMQVNHSFYQLGLLLRDVEDAYYCVSYPVHPVFDPALKRGNTVGV